MSQDGIKEVLQRTPFMPFTIRMTSGKEYRVNHPEFVSASGTFRRLFVATEDEDRMDVLDVLMIESVHYDEPKRLAA
jgi:hypothetical protein